MRKISVNCGRVLVFLILSLEIAHHDGKAEGLVSNPSQSDNRTSFSFGLIGDVPYSAKEEEQFSHLIKEMNQEPLAFIVHVGDIKSGSSPCDDTIYARRLKAFQVSRHPIVLIPGDNDWTDCHRRSSGHFDPEERLARLRKVFFSSESSLGQSPMPLVRQSQRGKYTAFVENVRWSVSSVLFIGLHIVGSNNNLGRTPKTDAEYSRRNQANMTWMSSFL